MGFDKALMPFRGYKSLSEYQLEKFKPYFKDIYISTKDSKKFSFKANFIHDLDCFKNSAPIIAIISIFEKLNSDKIFILPVDTPNFEIKHFYKLYNYAKKTSKIATIAKSKNKIHPLCAIYKKEIVPILKKMVQNQNFKIKTIFDMIEIDFVYFKDEQIFKNLNYPKDLI